jgi:hypothetical protein
MLRFRSCGGSAPLSLRESVSALGPLSLRERVRVRAYHGFSESVASLPGKDFTQRRKDAKKTAEPEGCCPRGGCWRIAPRESLCVLAPLRAIPRRCLVIMRQTHFGERFRLCRMTQRPSPCPLRAPTEGWSGEGTLSPRPLRAPTQGWSGQGTFAEAYWGEAPLAQRDAKDRRPPPAPDGLARCCGAS